MRNATYMHRVKLAKVPFFRRNILLGRKAEPNDDDRHCHPSAVSEASAEADVVGTFDDQSSRQMPWSRRRGWLSTMTRAEGEGDAADGCPSS